MKLKKMASTKCGLDAEECLMLHLERDFVRSFNFSVVEKIEK